MPPRPSQGGAGGGSGGMLGHAPRPSVPTLQKAPLPMEQLTQLQRRLTHCLSSLTELQEHVANAQTLDEWPALLNRHLTLVSQTHSLSQFLSLAAPNALNAKLSRRDEILVEDAQQNNKFSGDEVSNRTQQQDSTRVGDALFGGRSSLAGLDEVPEQQSLSLPRLRYSDGEDNPLAKVAPHPFYPLDAEKAQTVIPALLLPRGIDNSVAEGTEKRWRAWIDKYGNGEDASGNVEKLRAYIRTCRSQIDEHDAFATQALRSWIHAQEATDEMGQRYDWRMRLALDEEDDVDDVEAEEQDATSEAADRMKRKRDDDGEGEDVLTIGQVRRLLRGEG